jgi:hypothetical protein
MNSDRPNNLSLKYVRFTSLDFKDIWIRQFEFMTKNSVPVLNKMCWVDFTMGQGMNVCIVYTFTSKLLYQFGMDHMYQLDHTMLSMKTLLAICQLNNSETVANVKV